MGVYGGVEVRNRNLILLRGLGIVYTVALANMLHRSIGMLVFGDMLYDWLVDYMPPSFPRIINELKPLMTFLILLLLFWLLFLAIPRRQVTWHNAFWDAPVPAAGFVPFSTFSSFFVAHLSHYPTRYARLTA